MKFLKLVIAAFVASAFSSAALSQSAPSPIFNNVTVNGALSLTTQDLPVSMGGTGASSAANARTNLGLGTAATQNTGISGANVPLLNGANTWSAPQSFSSLTSSTAIPVASGGTGGATQAAARTGIGAAASGANSDITSLSGLTTPLSVGQGGTGGATQSAARTGIGAAASGANSDITSLTGLTTALSVAQGGTGGTSAATARTNLGILSMGLQSASSVAITGGSITGITDLAIADGGTGASDAPTARTNLGLTAAATMTATTGTFTPVMTFGGGSVGITYSTQTGSYVRIGPLVYFVAQIALTAKGTSTGNAIITGLPFAASNMGGAQIVNASGMSGYSPSFAQISSSSLSLLNFGTAFNNFLTDTNFTNTSALTISGIYNMGSF